MLPESLLAPLAAGVIVNLINKFVNHYLCVASAPDLTAETITVSDASSGSSH